MLTEGLAPSQRMQLGIQTVRIRDQPRQLSADDDVERIARVVLPENNGVGGKRLRLEVSHELGQDNPVLIREKRDLAQ